MLGSATAAVLVRAEVDDGRRSVRVQAELRAHWKQVVKRQPPATRERWLDSADGIAALGAKLARQLLRALRARAEAVAAAAPSAALYDAWAYGDEQLEGLGFDAAGRLVRVARPDGRRRHAVRLVPGVPAVRNGEEHPPGSPPNWEPVAGPPSSRWTPPQAVGLEDEIDALDWWAAARASMVWPGSPSAQSIRMIGILKGTEQERRTRDVSRKAYRAAKAEHERQQDNRGGSRSH
ncbi:MAG TPA: hypothetical protein VF796_27515 [Humisphaera sp.]